MPLCAIQRQRGVGLGTEWGWFQISFRRGDTKGAASVALATFPSVQWLHFARRGCFVSNETILFRVGMTMVMSSIGGSDAGIDRDVYDAML